MVRQLTRIRKEFPHAMKNYLQNQAMRSRHQKAATRKCLVFNGMKSCLHKGLLSYEMKNRLLSNRMTQYLLDYAMNNLLLGDAM